MAEDNNKIKKEEAEEYAEYGPAMGPRSVVESFKYAVDGILDVFRTQKHMRFHFLTVVGVLIAALLLKLDKNSMLILLFTISMVLIAEMFNTAIEAVVDMITDTYHPLAKFAKDAAAGAVLISTSVAVLIGLLLFVRDLPAFQGDDQDPGFAYKSIVIGVVLLFLVTIIKALGKSGKLLKGGIISGHATAAFFFAATTLAYSKNAFTAVLAILMALLVVQGRVQAKIHTVREVIVGAVVAILVTSLMYWILPEWSSWIVPWLQKVTHTS